MATDSVEYWDNLVAQNQRQAGVEPRTLPTKLIPSLDVAPPRGHIIETAADKEEAENDDQGLDDDDDDDDDMPYVEYTSSDGKKIFYDKAGRGVKATLGGPNLTGGAAGMDASQIENIRRNSTILNAAWGDVPGGGTGKIEKDEDFQDMSMEQVIDTVSRMGKNLNRIVETGQHTLPEEAVQVLLGLGGELAKIQKNLEEGKQFTDERTDVEALLDYKHLGWDFDNHAVKRYRSSGAARVAGHSRYQYTNWHLPQYTDNYPMPKNLKTASCVVVIPSEDGTEEGTTRIQVNDGELTAKGIQQAFKRVKGSANISEFLLKAQGLNDYMLPDQSFFDYSYVRRCLRNRIEPKLCLVKYPQPLEGVNAELKADYATKLSVDIPVIQEKTYQEVNNRDAAWFNIQALPMAETHIPLKVRLCGIDGIDVARFPRLGDAQISQISIEVSLIHGLRKLPGAVHNTDFEPIASCPRWFKWLTMPIISRLPREAKLAVMLMGKTDGDKKGSGVCLGYAIHQLVDEEGKMASGPVNLKMWSLPAKEKGKHGKKRESPDWVFRAPARSNLSQANAASIRIDFERFVVPIIAPLADKWQEPNKANLELQATVLGTNQKAALARFQVLCKGDALEEVRPEDHLLLWQRRETLSTDPNMLPKFLQAVDWGNRDHRFEAHRLLRKWAPPSSMITVMELLDVKFADYTVRKYAVDCLKKLGDNELSMYLLQFTQTLKFEPYHDSPLSRFLVSRALANPFIVGHPFFWHLKAELHEATCMERFALILEEYLSNCGRYAYELRKQNNVVLKLQRVASMIVKLKREEAYGDDIATKEYHAELHKLNRSFFEPMTKFQIPLEPKWEATTLIIEKCRFMSSKMVPLWLVFKNADTTAPPIIIMFKSGDDLRQDILTLQILTIMDNLWLSNGLDLRMLPYKVIATGVNENKEGVGMIEIVLKSETTSGIQVKFGGGAAGALKSDPIDLFLQKHNKGVHYEQAVENFVHSCAGYCVATYVLGIGDRHNGNIMVTQDGHLFHIDFGHFLGNFKSKFGVKRERAAFVFTVEMAYVMGGKGYKKSPQFAKFKDLCSRAFEILRVNANTLEVLFMLMVSAGMPELMAPNDICYMKNMLHLNLKPKQAEKELQSELKKSLATTYRRFDNYIHNLKHG